MGGLAPFTNMAGGVPDSAAGAITVQKGDNAYSLSRRYNVPLRDLIEVNRLSPPYKLEVGQRLALPTARQYIVQKGDTLYGISRMHNVDVSELTQLNNLTPPYAVQAGQPLRLPGAGGGAAPGSAPGSVAGPVVLAEASPPPGRSAGRGSIQATELPASGASVPPNAPASGGVVATPLPAGGVPAAGEPEVAYQPGQAPVSLRPPDRKPGVTAEPLPANPAASEPAPAAVASPVPPGLPAGRTAPAQQEVAAAAPPKPEPKAEAGAPPPRGGARFLWPVKGKLISGYGPKPDGLHNDGLNIAASKGTAVVAADNGVVAYAGNELRGFGNLLLLKHADGWITAYAHLDRIDVERGATVKRGQAVGKVGQTGSVSSPQLHFELRKGSQAVDPTDQMDRKSIEGAFRDGPLGPG
ncbi:LysM peptidoglycan-binding domain-containing protein [Azospirillum doebereinerae]|uniref:LysM peptidoglycan-binding domain-containing protein n=1 Tax=Azospirillum doebereinerae TaxID=92933 RepID=A0A3S0XCB8_9PROT|nr:LysM peptidoglycan-binding domain-containing protein [Azospirillum doebereinerae]